MLINKNMSTIDRISRILFGILLISLSLFGFNVVPVYWLSLFCFWFGLINILSSIVCWCFMYSIIGVSTKDDS